MPGLRGCRLARLRPGRGSMDVAQPPSVAGIEPMLNEAVRNGLIGRQQRRAGCDVGPSEPPRVLELLIMQVHHLRNGMRSKAQHQRRRKRPWLRGVILDGIDVDPRLLQYLASHRVLQRFSGFDEAGYSGITPDGPRRLATQQCAFAVADQYDDGGIQARKLLMPARGTGADENGAALGGHR